MSDELLIDQFLDEWEDLQESPIPLTLDQFVKERMKGADSELIKSFRKQAEQLASINRQLDQLAGPVTSVNHTLNGHSDDLRLSSLQPGLEPIPGYTLVSRLGNGGFGEVWKAESPGGFHVALKFVQIGGRVGEIEERSLNVIKDVRHPNLLSVFGTWRIGDLLIIATELADRTLLDRLDEARKGGHNGIPKEELFDYLAEAAKAIDFLNDPGKSGRIRIQHRDIKPQNLLLSGGSVKVGDFGLARSMKYDATGHTGSLTFAYAAPECFDGTTSNRSDQYSLAVTYCLLCGGRLPFEGSQVEIMNGHRKKQPDLSMVPANERPAIGKALAKRPKDRWNSCTDFVQALADSVSQSGMPSHSSLVATVQYQLAELPKKWLFSGAAIAFLLLFCLSLLLFSGYKPDENDPSQVGSNGASVAGLVDADTATKPITLAIMDFDNHSQDRNLDGFRLGFRDMLVTSLSRVSSLKVLERGRLKDLLDEHELAKSPFIDPKAAVRFGKGLSAKHVLTGSYVIEGNDIRVDVRLVSVETGEVMLADAVTGKKSNIFLLEQALSAKVLAGLDIQASEAEQVALNDPQTNEFDAFRLYSEARLAQLKGQSEKAEKRFKEALELDPDFSLAARELDRLESAALFRLSDAQQERAKAAGEIGQFLQEHWNKHREIVERDLGDAEYFASIIVLAAHAGLLGDFERERRLLITFWKQFSESVPPSQALVMAQEIRESISTESKFFQETVDSGDYSFPLFEFGSMTPTTMYLKSELQRHYHWPKWSVIWPFSEDARTAFGQANIASIPLARESWKSSFEADLPSDPHDYLEAVIDFGSVLEDQRKNPARFIENLQIYLSIAQFYGRLPDCPKPLAKELRDLQGRVLRLLDRVDVSQMEPAVIQNALPVLERITSIETDATKREQADKLLVRFVRQVRVNEGLPATSDDKPYNFYGQPLAGSPILVVWHVGELGGFDIARNRIEDHVRESLGDAVRALPGDTLFNFLWAGYVNEEKAQSLFEGPRAADTIAKQKGLGWLSQKAPSAFEETRPLGKVIKTITQDGSEHGFVVIIALNEDVSVPQDTINFLLRSRSPPRFLVVTTDKHKQLAQLAAASNGVVILLKAEGGFLGSDNVVAEPWDVSN
ncbi:protein kinase domain-containing protein [Gimesia sp.]|uniref:protein kinase domain-containing protein n=1 Tax=Gimesia sp. TaxID=2024833 RepID=UPI003A917866